MSRSRHFLDAGNGIVVASRLGKRFAKRKQTHQWRKLGKLSLRDLEQYEYAEVEPDYEEDEDDYLSTGCSYEVWGYGDTDDEIDYYDDDGMYGYNEPYDPYEDYAEFDYAEENFCPHCGRGT